MSIYLHKSNYLPKEILTFPNYPEVETVKAEIEELINYYLSIHTALFNYNDALADKLYLDSNTLDKKIKKTRELCHTLGTADRVCFDILLELRKIQYSLQKVKYLSQRFGNSVVGTFRNGGRQS